MIRLIKRLKLRLKDMGMVKKLFIAAEEYANKRGENIPGEEHMLLSALDLPDGTARRVFERAGTDPDQLGEAIEKQYIEALQHIGIDASKIDLDNNEGEIVKPTRKLYDAKPSVQILMKELVELRRMEKDIPLLGLHIVEVLSGRKLGVVARALKQMGIEPDVLDRAIADELECYKLADNR